MLVENHTPGGYVMKAVSPVIATLILIAIAVIAGVFVLRQFLAVAGQVGGQQSLKIMDAVFYRKLTPDGKNMTITLQITIKNEADRQITIDTIAVPDANFKAEKLNVVLNSGDTWTTTYTIINNESYNLAWEKGQQHAVVVYYYVAGNPNLQSTSVKATVM